MTGAATGTVGGAVLILSVMAGLLLLITVAAGSFGFFRLAAGHLSALGKKYLLWYYKESQSKYHYNYF